MKSSVRGDDSPYAGYEPVPVLPSRATPVSPRPFRRVLGEFLSRVRNGFWRPVLLVGVALVFAFVAGAAALLGFQMREWISQKIAAFTQEPPADLRVSQWRTIETGLVTLQRADIKLGDTEGLTTGGAIDSIGDTVLYVSAGGRIATVNLDSGRIRYSKFRVPMDSQRLREGVFREKAQFNPSWYRVQDILIKREAAPDQATLYVSHHLFLPETSEICSVISRTRLDTGDGDIKLVDGVWEEFYRSSACVSMIEFDWTWLGLESGGKMLLQDDNHILMSVGGYGLALEFATPGRVGGQDADFCKILRLDLTTGERTVYARGVRNPEGLAWGADGGLWETEHGPQGGDEVNFIRQGGDYGWPNVSLGMGYGSPRNPLPQNPAQGRHDGFEKPAFAFMPSIGISALVALPSDPPTFRRWKGDLLATSLKAQSLFHLRRDKDRIVYAEKIALGVRLRDVILLDNNWIAILTDWNRSLILLRDGTDPDEQPAPAIAVSGYEVVSEMEGASRAEVGHMSPERWTFRDQCSGCHSVNGENRVGPPLNGIFERGVGAAPGFAYRGELAKAHGKWTKSKIRAFIRDPAAMYPGSTMPAITHLQKRQEELILDYLTDLEGG